MVWGVVWGRFALANGAGCIDGGGCAMISTSPGYLWSVYQLATLRLAARRHLKQLPIGYRDAAHRAFSVPPDATPSNYTGNRHDVSLIGSCKSERLAIAVRYFLEMLCACEGSDG